MARELGIPAVVSVDGATTRIRDGDAIEVNGALGTVRFVSSKPKVDLRWVAVAQMDLVNDSAALAAVAACLS